MKFGKYLGDKVGKHGQRNRDAPKAQLQHSP